MMLRNMRKWIWQSTVSNSVPLVKKLGLSWPWSYGSRIYNYQCKQCLSPVMLWVRISTRARCTTLCDKVCPWLATGRWFSPSPPLSSTNKTDRHDIIEILLKVVLNTITLTLTLLMIFLFSRDGMLKRNKVKTEWILKPQKEYSKLLKFD